MTGVRLDEDSGEQVSLVDHLLMRIRVVDEDGRELASGRDYGALCQRMAGQLSEQRVNAPVAAAPEKASAQAGQAPLPAKVRRRQAGIDVDFWPAWVEQGEAVVEQLFDNPLQAAQAHRHGVQRLLLQRLPEQVKYLRQKLTTAKEAAIYYRDLGTQQQLTEDLLLAAIDRACLAPGSALPRSPQELESCAARGRAELIPVAEKLGARVLEIMKLWHGLQKRFKGRIDLSHAIAMNDVRTQLDNLVFRGFVREVPAQWLDQYPRYFNAIAQRLDKLPGQVQRDRVWTDELQGFWQQYQSLSQRYRVEGREDERRGRGRRMREEYRVSLFAQQLGTRMPVSDKRLKKHWQEITG